MNETVPKSVKDAELLKISDSYLNTMSDEALMECFRNIEETASILLKENNVYKSILSQLDETIESEITESITKEDCEILPTAKKCFLARKHLENLQEGLNNTKSNYFPQLKQLKLKLDSLKLTLKNTEEAKDNFCTHVLLEKHPVSKKVILQKVARYLEDKIKYKRAMSNRYKIQIESLVMDSNKLLSQLKDQNKRLVSIDFEKCQEMKYEHLKTCDALQKQKKSVVVCKRKYNTLGQKVFELKKALQKEESELSNIEEVLSKKKYMKSVMLSEKEWNGQREQGLIEAIHKIKVDPRRHDLPEVFDYACVKRENENLKRNIKMWKKKVAYVEQAKLIHINALKKKKKAS